MSLSLVNRLTWWHWTFPANSLGHWRHTEGLPREPQVSHDFEFQRVWIPSHFLWCTSRQSLHRRIEQRVHLFYLKHCFMLWQLVRLGHCGRLLGVWTKNGDWIESHPNAPSSTTTEEWQSNSSTWVKFKAIRPCFHRPAHRLQFIFRVVSFGKESQKSYADWRF